jgi:hypothetical protein
MFKECTNPLCENPIESDNGKSWRRTPKKFCSDKCRVDVWALRKTADLLSAFSADRKLEVLEVVTSVNNQRKSSEDDKHGIKDDTQYKTNFTRRYKCEQLPRLRIGGKVRFCEGFFETRDPELIALVERNELYGAQILQVDRQVDKIPDSPEHVI